MPKTTLVWVMVATLVVAVFGTVMLPAKTQADVPKLQHIFVISVDGLSYEGFINSSVPHLKHLAGEGVIDEKCLGVKAEAAETAQASLLTGALPEVHKYYSAEDRLQMATILDMLKNGGRSFMVLDGSGGKLKAFDYGEAHYRSVDATATDQQVLDLAVEIFEEQKPFFNFIVLNDCWEARLTLDEKRHHQAIAQTDTAIGEFLAFLRNQKLYYNSIIMVTSARSCSLSDQVPLIIHGPHFQVGTRIGHSMILDITPTICLLSGLKTPLGSRGIPLYDALLYTSEERGSQLQKWVKALQEERSLNWQQNYQMQDEIYRNYHQISAMKEERQNIFAYAGEKEDVIIGLKQRLMVERGIFGLLFLLLLVGYGVEYVILKKRFLLFK